MWDDKNTPNNSRVDEKELIEENGGSLLEKLRSFKRKREYILYFIREVAETYSGFERCVGSLFEADDQIVALHEQGIVSFYMWNDGGLFFNLYTFILLTSTIVPGINYFVVITHPLHQLQVRKRSSSSSYMIET